jgi:hypothetical protein
MNDWSGCGNPNYRHGLSWHRLYTVWKDMTRRCRQTKRKGAHRYALRGISVCEEWIDDPSAFIDWGMKNGYAPGLDLDRRDNNGNYEPFNCRFITRRENSNNTSKNRIVIFRGVEMTLSELANHSAVCYKTLVSRITKFGWDIETAATTPARVMTKGDWRLAQNRSYNRV